MNQATSTTSARKKSERSRNATSPLKAHPAISGLGMSWMPNAPRVRPRQFRKTLKLMMAKAEGDEDENIVPEPVEHYADHDGCQPS